MIKSPKISEIY